jgi:5-methyltetrahydropteroyltriglutamate--homocysteine methyltransferase
MLSLDRVNPPGSTTLGPRTSPPFRADHVGSLLRPPELFAARAAFADGSLTAEGLRAAEDEAIAAAVRMQEDVGLRSATDGEYRRKSWMTDFAYQLAGIEPTGTIATPAPAGGRLELSPRTGASLMRVDGRIGLDHVIFGDDFAALRSLTTTATPKLTIPSPSMIHFRSGREEIDEDVYPDLEAFWDDLVGAYRDEIAGLAELGCTYLQLDDVSLAYVNDPAQRDRLARMGADPDHQHETYIAQMNRVLAAKPEGMRITTHLCRGNLRSSWMAQGGYDFVAEALFGDLGVDGFFLEYDDERSGGFEPLRFVPRDKVVVLGLVTSKRGELESKDDLKRRIEEASRYIDVDQLCLSPQCGFASVVEGNALSYEQQVAKLRLIVETAEEVWG